jgi:hypothetical protein
MRQDAWYSAAKKVLPTMATSQKVLKKQGLLHHSKTRIKQITVEKTQTREIGTEI